MTRKRGARPGNTNALKHGLHSSRLKTSEVALLQGTSKNLSEAINTLGVISHFFIWF